MDKCLCAHINICTNAHIKYMYYNYHARAKNLILTHHCIGASIFSNYHHIYPALVLYFDNHKPIPIREYRWNEYLDMLKTQNITIQNDKNIPLE